MVSIVASLLGTTSCRASEQSVTTVSDLTVTAKAIATAEIKLVPAPRQITSQCARTASQLHYPVPCPGLLPRDAVPTPIIAGPCGGRFRDLFIHIGCDGASRYAFASIDFFPSDTSVGHLVLIATPIIESARDAVYAPGPPVVRSLRVVARARIGSARAQCVRVPPGSDSAFGGHLVWVWRVAGHTYAVGFHGYDQASATGGLRLARSIRSVR